VAGRYDGVGVAVVTVRDSEGAERQVRYLRQSRPAPPAGGRPALATHLVIAGDRLDTVTARYLGDSLAYWRVADANPALGLHDLIGPAPEGLLLQIPTPEV
jgi:phage tail protein X